MSDNKDQADSMGSSESGQGVPMAQVEAEAENSKPQSLSAEAEVAQAAAAQANKTSAEASRASNAANQAGSGNQSSNTISNKTNSRRSPVLLLLNLILVLAVAGLGYLYWEQDKAVAVLFSGYNESNATSNKLTEQVETLQSAALTATGQVQQQLAEALNLTKEQQLRLDELNRELVSLRLRVNDSATGGSQQWMLSEVESLLRMAQQRLVSAREVRTAMSLMISADDVLKRIPDPAINTVRAAIASDLDVLEGVRVPDVQGMYSALGDLSDRLNKLVVVSTEGNADATYTFTAPDVATESADASWLDSIGNTLSRYFVVSQRAVEQVPQLTPEQALLFHQLVRLQLEEARLALLRGETRLYQRALSDAEAGISSYLEGPDKNAILQQLASLRETPVTTLVPPAGNGLNALRLILPANGGQR